MDTSNSHYETADAYRFSTEPEEIAFYQKAVEAYTEVMRRLAPIANYITDECGYTEKAVFIKVAPVLTIKDKVLAISFRGELVARNSDSHMWDEKVPEDLWQSVPFIPLLEGLHQVLKQAEDKKRKHLDAVTQRREFVESILTTFKFE